MHFVLQTPSLQHLAGVKIVTRLWSQRDVYTQITPPVNLALGYVLNEEAKQWKVVEEKVESNVWALPLPEACKKELVNFVKPISIEISAWSEHHNGVQNNFHNLDILFRNQLCWSMHGTIEYTKTAELMVKDEGLDEERRYEIACVNCLEDVARQLFESLGEERREEYADALTDVIDELDSNLIAYFTPSINCHRFPGALADDTWLFQETLRSGNRAAYEHLFNNLNQREKERVLKGEGRRRILGGELPTCSLLYYWSLMSEEQQRTMFEECTHDVLERLLRWPMQVLFLEAVECGWGYLSKGDNMTVLTVIIGRSCEGLQHFDFCRLFWKCWSLSSADCKQRYFHDFGTVFFRTKRKEFIQLFVNEAPSHQLKELVEKRDVYGYISDVLMDESVISDAALMECVETAALNISKGQNNMEKRLRSQRVSRLVDKIIEDRNKRRRLV